MRFNTDRPTRRRSILAAPVVAGALALLVSACGSSSPTSSNTTTPGSPSALLTAGLAAQKTGNVTLAIDNFKKAVAAAPSAASASYANYDLGYIAQVNQNDASAASTYYRAALAVNPNFANALYNLAIVLTKSQPLVAENNYLQVIALQPNNADAHLNLGFLYSSKGSHTLAHAQFVKATALDPTLAKRLPAGF
jgi:tetratricopeptide (TPR) repeat protein